MSIVLSFQHLCDNNKVLSTTMVYNKSTRKRNEIPPTLNVLNSCRTGFSARTVIQISVQTQYEQKNFM